MAALFLVFILTSTFQDISADSLGKETKGSHYYVPETNESHSCSWNFDRPLDADSGLILKMGNPTALSNCYARLRLRNNPYVDYFLRDLPCCVINVLSNSTCKLDAFLLKHPDCKSVLWRVIDKDKVGYVKLLVKKNFTVSFKLDFEYFKCTNQEAPTAGKPRNFRSVGYIAGIVILLLLLIAACVALLLLYAKYRPGFFQSFLPNLQSKAEGVEGANGEASAQVEVIHNQVYESSNNLERVHDECAEEEDPYETIQH